MRQPGNNNITFRKLQCVWFDKIHDVAYQDCVQWIHHGQHWDRRLSVVGHSLGNGTIHQHRSPQHVCQQPPPTGSKWIASRLTCEEGVESELGWKTNYEMVKIIRNDFVCEANRWKWRKKEEESYRMEDLVSSNTFLHAFENLNKSKNRRMSLAQKSNKMKRGNIWKNVNGILSSTYFVEVVRTIRSKEPRQQYIFVNLFRRSLRAIRRKISKWRACEVKQSAGAVEANV